MRKPRQHHKCSVVLQVDDRSRSVSIDSIWGIGDVTSRVPLTPVARMEGTQLALHLFGWGTMAPLLAVLPARACSLPEASLEASHPVASQAEVLQVLRSIYQHIATASAQQLSHAALHLRAFHLIVLQGSHGCSAWMLLQGQE